MKKKLFAVMILFAFMVSSVFANTGESGVWQSGTTGAVGRAASMTVRLDLSTKRASEYAVAFTSNKISSYSDELTNVNTITLAPDTTTMKFKDYGGDDKLYISYKFKENTAVALFLEVESSLKDADNKASVKYAALFDNGSVQRLESDDAQTSIKVKDFEDKAVVGSTEVGSIPLTISAIDTFESAVTRKLSSTMKLIVRSEG